MKQNVDGNKRKSKSEWKTDIFEGDGLPERLFHLVVADVVDSDAALGRKTECKSSEILNKKENKKKR